MSKNDRPGRLQVRKPDGATDVIEVDCATPVFGADGYSLSLRDLRIGDVVAVVKERHGLELVTKQLQCRPRKRR